MRAKGYPTQSGYMGLVRGGWMLFPTEGEYLEYLREENGEGSP